MRQPSRGGLGNRGHIELTSKNNCSSCSPTLVTRTVIRVVESGTRVDNHQECAGFCDRHIAGDERRLEDMLDSNDVGIRAEGNYL